MRRVLGILTLYIVARVAGSIDRGVSTSVATGHAGLELDSEGKFKIATAIAEQIWREQQLTSNRMTWNLTFQGFLITAFGFTFSSLSASIPSVLRMFVQIVLAAGGIAVGQATQHSIRASQFQRDFMKAKWEELYNPPGPTSYPRPFSVNPESERGRRSATSIIKTILCMWVALGMLAVLSAIASNWELIWATVKRLGS